MEKKRATLLFLLLTSFACLLGGASRIYFVQEPLWIDELHSAWTVDDSLWSVSERAGQGNQTPLFFWIQWLTCQVLGQSNWILRLPSLAASTVSIFLVAYIVRRWTGSTIAAATSALIVSWDSWLIFFGSEARPYAMLQMVSLLQIYSLSFEIPKTGLSVGTTRFCSTTSVNWLLVASTILMLATHLASLFLISVELLLVAALPKKFNLKRIACSFAVASMSWIFLYPVLAKVVANRRDWTIISDWRELWIGLLPTLIVFFFAPFALVVAQAIYRNVVNRNAIQQQTGRWVLLTLTAFCGAGPIAVVIALSLFDLLPIASVRFTSAGMLALPIFAGLALAQFQRASLRIGSCLMLLVLAAAVNPIFQTALLSKSSFQYRGEGWDSATRRINSHVIGEKQLVFLFSNLVEDYRLADIKPGNTSFVGYLKFPLSGIYKLNNDAVIIPMPTNQRTQRWTNKQITMIRQNRGAQIVARVSPLQFKSILNELIAQANVAGFKIKLNIEQQPGNLILIATVCPDR